MLRIIKNPDIEEYERIRKAVEDNNHYCPCRLQKTPDTKCMCKEFRDQVERGEEGYCHCSLYCVVKE